MLASPGNLRIILLNFLLKHNGSKWLNEKLRILPGSYLRLSVGLPCSKWIKQTLPDGHGSQFSMPCFIPLMHFIPHFFFQFDALH